MIHVSRMTVPHAQRALAIRRVGDAAKNVFFCVHTGQLLRLIHPCSVIKITVGTPKSFGKRAPG